MASLMVSLWNSNLSCHHHNRPCHPPFSTPNNHNGSLLIHLSSPLSKGGAVARASSDDGKSSSTSSSSSPGGLLDEELLRLVSAAKDADEALAMILERRGGGGVVSAEDCRSIIDGAFARNNVELALSIFEAMRSGFSSGVVEKESTLNWARPDVQTYALLVRRLAASLRVSEAMRMINFIAYKNITANIDALAYYYTNCFWRQSFYEGRWIFQVASCSKCRYQYELVSGDIVSILSEEISMDISAWEKGLRFLQIVKNSIPAAVHSIVVRTPNGIARTHRFATKTVEVPAQEGERVTVSSSAPSNVNTKVPGFGPGEPMSVTNHISGQESQLLRAPSKNGTSFLLNPSVLFPFLALLATGDAASGMIDPSLPRIISVAAIASVAIGTTVNRVVLPRLNQLPQRMVDIVALKQQLLSQYDMLQMRIKDLSQAAEKEISSMIEIEVEMDSDVLAAEAESIAEQIQQIMEIENLEERWRIQAEANDEVEMLLSSQPVSPEHI
ncbi:hypothetical protein QJS10_CPA03g00874 [Acorus calamus]|uniref:Pentatricopeptide repeat-containing protein n=1 Tax=Acorus calamus TaxID=4465 RepID=A0AAV9FBR9_ACOCL|nr:hypothetical protein QJS10_CPA03g00874 [Acorus calamus]